METKFTPGPWRVDPKYPMDVQTADGTFEIAGLDPETLCGGETPEHGQRLANARLIAAAPELYEALNQAICLIPLSQKTAIANFNAALAKARGDQ